MDLTSLMQPFTIVFDFMRNYQITIGGISFSLMDVNIWLWFASAAIWFYKKITE